MSEPLSTEFKPKSKLSAIRVVLIVMGVLTLFRIVGREMDRAATDRAYADAAAITNRQVTREGVSDALVHAQAASKVVESYFNQHSTFPASLTAADFQRPLPEAVQSIRVGADGALRVVLMGSGRRELRSFRLQPTIDSGGKFSWVCKPEEIPRGVLPPSCIGGPGGG